MSKYSLNNGLTNKGLKYVILDTKCGESATVMIMFKVGSHNEPPKFNGISHFIEHVFFKGNKVHKTSRDISTEITKFGSEFNAFTSYDITGYYIKIPSEHINTAIDILSNMMYKSYFRESDLEIEKGVVISEIKRHTSEPSRLSAELLNEEVYKDTNYDHNIGGVSSNIKGYTKNMILSYINKHYNLRNACILVVGKIPQSHQKLKSYIDKRFGSNIKYPCSTDKYSSLLLKYDNMVENFMDIQKKERYISKEMKSDQSFINIGFPCYSYNNQDSYVADLIGVVLAGNMGSRLYKQIRDISGLAYSVSYSLEDMEDVGSITFSSDTFDDKKSIDKVLTIIIKELNDIKNNSITKDELDNALGYILGDISLMIEDSKSLSTLLGKHYLVTNKCITIDEFKNNYKHITLNDVKRVANNIFKSNKANVSIVSKSSLSKKEISHLTSKLN